MIKESDTLELKKSLAQLKEGVISLSSMLNKNGQGTLIFGINDEGRVVGIDVGKKTIADITHEIRNNLKPLPTTVNVNQIEMENRVLIKVIVEGDDSPYCAYGRYYIRIDDADIQMDSMMLQKFFEKKDESYLKWEQAPTKYTVEDVDEELLIDCVRSANDKGRLNYVYRNPIEALNKFGLLTEDGKLNNAGWYLFGKNKPLTIKEANFPTDSRTEFGEIKEYRGNIFECINEAMTYIKNHMSYKAKIVDLKREEYPEIPIRAIREMVVNSFAHCAYARVGDFNQYMIFHSSIKIYNPGTIIKGIDPMSFASGKVGSKIRNLLIASTLFKCGYIDAFGTGFDRTFTLCSQEGITYEYYEDEFGFTFIFNRNQDYLSDSFINPFLPNLHPVDLAIMNEMKFNKYITISELAKKIDKSEPTINRHLSFLTEHNYIKRVGSKKTGYWELNVYLK